MLKKPTWQSEFFALPFPQNKISHWLAQREFSPELLTKKDNIRKFTTAFNRLHQTKGGVYLYQGLGYDHPRTIFAGEDFDPVNPYFKSFKRPAQILKRMIRHHLRGEGFFYMKQGSRKHPELSDDMFSCLLFDLDIYHGGKKAGKRPVNYHGAERYYYFLCEICRYFEAKAEKYTFIKPHFYFSGRSGLYLAFYFASLSRHNTGRLRDIIQGTFLSDLSKDVPVSSDELHLTPGYQIKYDLDNLGNNGVSLPLGRRPDTGGQSKFITSDSIVCNQHQYLLSIKQEKIDVESIAQELLTTERSSSFFFVNESRVTLSAVKEEESGDEAGTRDTAEGRRDLGKYLAVIRGEEALIGDNFKLVYNTDFLAFICWYKGRHGRSFLEMKLPESKSHYVSTTNKNGVLRKYDEIVQSFTSPGGE